MKTTLATVLRGTLLILAVLAPQARAATYTWNNNAGGNWATAGNWTPSGPPAAGSTAYIDSVGFGSMTISFSSNLSSALGNLYLDGGSFGIWNQTISQSSSTSYMNVSGNEIIGYESTQGLAIYSQSSGTNHGNSIYVGDNGNGEYELSGGLLTSGGETVGSISTGVFIQTGGTNTIGNLFIGADLGTGTYSLQSGVLSAGIEIVGDGIGPGSGGNAVFNQTGGMNTVSNILYVSFDDGAGSYTLQNGTLSAGTEVISTVLSLVTTGTFTQSGGLNSVGGSIEIGTNGGNGAFVLSGGNLTASGTIFVGDGGTGSFTGTSGVIFANSLAVGTGGNGNGNGTLTETGSGDYTISDTVYVGNGAIGNYTLQDSILTAGVEIAGFGSSGTFVQTSGSNLISYGLYIGGGTDYNNNSASGTGSYTLQSGSLSAAVAPNSSEVIGGVAGSYGSFTQNGGVNANGGNLYLGTNGTGVYLQTAGMNSIAGGLSIGTGTYTQTSGTDAVTGDININGAASYLLQGGLLTANSEDMGYGTDSSGSMVQSGGTYTIATDLNIGRMYGAGSYTLQSGSLSAEEELIGQGEPGFPIIGITATFLQTGGFNVVSDTLTIGDTNGFGSYTLQGGSLSAVEEILGSAIILIPGNGSFVQSGGTNTISDTLTLGYYHSTGSYALQAGLLSANYESLGPLDGNASIAQTGGTNAVAGTIYIGMEGGSGTYALQGGLLSALSEIVGANGTNGSGTFAQSGGTNSVTAFYVGGGVDSTDSSTTGIGSYTLQSGLLSTGSEYLGYNGPGNFAQTGGTNTTTNLYISYGAGSSGSYSLQGGLVSTGSELTDDGGTGYFTQTGGTNSITNLYIGNNAAGSGSYSLQGGLLSAGSEFAGNGGNGNFTQTGGTNTITSLYVGNNTTGSGSYSLAAGLLSAMLEHIGQGGMGNFAQTGGTNTIGSGGSLAIYSGTYALGGGVLNAPGTAGGFSTQPGGVFNMQGNGVENGYFQNFGVFNFTSGTFNGTLENDGTFNVYSNAFNAAAGIINNVLISVGTAYSLDGGGAIGLDNEGEIDLTSGTIGGANTLNDGLISGYGVINGSNFTNYGLVTQGAGNLTLSATGLNQNLGNINLAAGRQLKLTGATLVNEGGLNLNGGIVTGAAELDNSTGGVITGPGSILGPFSNDAGGALQLGAGTVSISQAFTNSGLISFTSTTAGLTGAGLTNYGTIQGVGNVGSTTLTNDGIINPIAGTLDITGTLTNPASGEILPGAGSKVLVTKGLAINAGLINLGGGSFDNNGHALTNNGEISGYGTFGSGGLTNNTSITLTGGQITINGSVTDASGGTITISYNPAIFTGNVTINSGATFKTIGTTATFAGTFTNNGSFISDPCTLNFTDFVTGPGGLVTASTGDVYNVSGDVANTSTQNTAFDMSQATLTLQGAVNHQFTWAGADLGATMAGYTNNFAIGTLELQSGGSMTLHNGNSTSGMGVYAGTLELDGGLSQISSITGNGFNIYYDYAQSGNAYLEGATYALQGGGDIEAIFGANIMVNTGGTLLLNVSGLASGHNVNLNGGTLALNPAGGSTETLGTLTLSAASTIDFGGGGNTLTFTTLGTYGGNELTVNNYTSNSDILAFTGDTSSDVSAFAGNVQFNIGGNDVGAAEYMISPGVYGLEPVPEPGTIAAGLGMLGFVLWRERRRTAILVSRLKKIRLAA